MKILFTTTLQTKFKGQRSIENNGHGLKMTGMQATTMMTSLHETNSYEPLGPNLIQVRRLPDINQDSPSASPVHSQEFHKFETGLFMNADAKSMQIFKVTGTHAQKLQSLRFQDMNLHKSSFVLEHSILITGKKKFFYLYDLTRAHAEKVQGIVGLGGISLASYALQPKTNAPLVAFLGQRDSVELVSLKSRLAVGKLQINGTCRCATFSEDGGLWTAGYDGVAHYWDLRMHRCLARFVNEEGSSISALESFCYKDSLATGSDSGRVNIYRCSEILAKHSLPGAARTTQQVPPKRTFSTLNTAIHHLQFSSDGQLAAIASGIKKNSFRLVHISSGTTFHNWPTSNTPVGFVHSVAFSPRNGLLTLGNAKGRTFLYRLVYYKQI